MNLTSSDQVFSFFESFTNLERSMSFTEREYRLDRMFYLLKLFDNPEKSLKIIHVAGSKGKGSTATAAAAILAALGHKTGLYTSPHLISYKERITHAGVFINESTLILCGNMVKTMIEKEIMPFPDPPTTFELLTLYAFLVFRETKCEWAVVETGIGGRLDATNVRKDPEASIITPIEMEHSDILGDTIEKITFEKSGIIKENKPVFVSKQKEKSLSIIKKTAQEKNSPLYLLEDHIILKNISVTKISTSFDFTADAKDYSITINLSGEFQAYNTALAMLTVKTVLEIDYYEITKNLKEIPLKGRIEIIQGKEPVSSEFDYDSVSDEASEAADTAVVPDTGKGNAISEQTADIIIDSSHTTESASMLAETLKKIYQGKGILIFGSVQGKDFKGMMKNLSSCFDDVIISKPGTFKKSSPNDIFAELKMIYPEKNIILETDAEIALKVARDYSAGYKHIVVTGSFYMASEIKKLL